ncbi:MAG: phage tail protein, partial [Anaerotruncus colihominis]
MATIGCLGDVAFTVSDSVIRTLSNFQWSGSARYATHQRHLGRGLLEFTGTDPDKISFDITLSAQLGVTPAKEIARIAKYVS